jgi:hypothetical protein
MPTTTSIALHGGFTRDPQATSIRLEGCAVDVTAVLEARSAHNHNPIRSKG